MKTHPLAPHSLPLDDSWDVIVIGGGPAGSCAAAAAAREGAKTLLIERAGALGGMGTLGLVPWVCGYVDGEKVIARGLAERIRQGLIHGMPHVDMTHTTWFPPIDPELLKRIYDDLVIEAGAEVLFHSQLCSVEAEDGRVHTLLVANKAGLTAYRANVYVDCTGDGDLAAWAGATFEKGDEDGNLMPATACFVLTNVEPYPCTHTAQRAPGSPPSLHFPDPESPIHAAMASGRYPLIPDKHSCSKHIGPKAYGYNFGHVYDVDNTDPFNVSRAMVCGRRQAAQYLQAFTDLHPSFKEAFLATTGASLGIRETRRILGDYTLTVDDYLARRSFSDEICRNAYPIDIHSTKPGSNTLTPAEMLLRIEHESRQLGKGESFGVPYRCLTPRGLDNVLVAGRCISTDRTVNGSTRIMACAMTMGEAAGLAAALTATASQSDVHAVNTDTLRTRLRQHGAYLP